MPKKIHFFRRLFHIGRSHVAQGFPIVPHYNHATGTSLDTPTQMFEERLRAERSAELSALRRPHLYPTPSNTALGSYLFYLSMQGRGVDSGPEMQRLKAANDVLLKTRHAIPLRGNVRSSQVTTVADEHSTRMTEAGRWATYWLLGRHPGDANIRPGIFATACLAGSGNCGEHGVVAAYMATMKGLPSSSASYHDIHSFALVQGGDAPIVIDSWASDQAVAYASDTSWAKDKGKYTEFPVSATDVALASDFLHGDESVKIREDIRKAEDEMRQTGFMPNQIYFYDSSSLSKCFLLATRSSLLNSDRFTRELKGVTSLRKMGYSLKDSLREYPRIPGPYELPSSSNLMEVADTSVRNGDTRCASSHRADCLAGSQYPPLEITGSSSPGNANSSRSAVPPQTALLTEDAARVPDSGATRGLTATVGAAGTDGNILPGDGISSASRQPARFSHTSVSTSNEGRQAPLAASQASGASSSTTVHDISPLYADRPTAISPHENPYGYVRMPLSHHLEERVR